MRDIAERRISTLLALSMREASSGNKERSKRYFRLARAIGMRTNTPLPKGTLYCRRCEALLLPGSNCRVRLRNGRITVHCLTCGEVRRRPYLWPKGDDDGKKAEQEGAEGERD